MRHVAKRTTKLPIASFTINRANNFSVNVNLKDSVRSNKRAFEETGVEEIDSEDSLGVGVTQ